MPPSLLPLSAVFRRTTLFLTLLRARAIFLPALSLSRNFSNLAERPHSALNGRRSRLGSHNRPSGFSICRHTSGDTFSFLVSLRVDLSALPPRFFPPCREKCREKPDWKQFSRQRRLSHELPPLLRSCFPFLAISSFIWSMGMPSIIRLRVPRWRAVL